MPITLDDVENKPSWENFCDQDIKIEIVCGFKIAECSQPYEFFKKM